MKAVQAFIDAWVDDPLGTKSIFSALFNDLVEKKQVKLEFHERPGISYSLRGIHEKQISRPLFVMIDVIDDDPNARWLSVCFPSINGQFARYLRYAKNFILGISTICLW
jgi:hypothetical protein